jgi:hypothetical protein
MLLLVLRVIDILVGVVFNLETEVQWLTFEA